MNNTEEKKLYYNTLTKILYRYLEFILSFDNNKCYNYMDLFSQLEDAYNNILKTIDEMDELHLNSQDAIKKIEELILKELASANIVELFDIKEGLSDKDISDLSISLYLKHYKDSINNELTSILEILSAYDTSEAKLLTEQINMFKSTYLSTSITSTKVDNKLMSYYANSLRIEYDEFKTANMYTFIMLNLISGINENLSRFLDSIGQIDIQMHDVSGHLDCFNSHKEELNAIYSIDDLSECLTNLHSNINAFIALLRDKNKKVSLQLDVKSGN